MKNKLMKFIVITMLISTRLYAPVLAEDSKNVIQYSNQTLLESANLETKPSEQVVNPEIKPTQKVINQSPSNPRNTLGGLALIAEMGTMIVGGLILLPIILPVAILSSLVR